LHLVTFVISLTTCRWQPARVITLICFFKSVNVPNVLTTRNQRLCLQHADLVCSQTRGAHAQPTAGKSLSVMIAKKKKKPAKDKAQHDVDRRDAGQHEQGRRREGSGDNQLVDLLNKGHVVPREVFHRRSIIHVLFFFIDPLVLRRGFPHTTTVIIMTTSSSSHSVVCGSLQPPLTNTTTAHHQSPPSTAVIITTTTTSSYMCTSSKARLPC
jgi:hypothetical protein